MTRIWKVKKFTKSNLAEYFYYFFIAALIIILVLSGTLYFMYTSVMEDEIIRSNNTILEQIKNAQDTVLTEVEKSIVNIAIDSSIANFEDIYNSRDIIMIRMIQERMSSYTAHDSYIGSISVIYFDNEKVLTSDLGYVGLDLHYDKKFLESLSNTKDIKRQILIRDMPQNSSTASLQVMTLVNPIPLNPSGNPRAAIVVNINSKYLRNTLDYIDVRKGSNIIITDQSGARFIQKNPNKAMVSDISQYVDFNQTSENSSEVKKVDGSRYLVSCVTSSSYGLRFIYIVSMSTITEKLDTLGTITLLVCLGLFVMSILISLVLSRKIYSPIKGIMGLLHETDESGGSSGDMVKETKAIQRGISTLVDTNKNLTQKNKDLETVLAEYQVYQRNQFLRDFICGETAMDEKVTEKLAYYEIDIDMSGYIAIVLISIDNYSEFLKEYSEKQKNMLDIYINENISEAVLKGCKGFISEIRKNEKAVLLNIDKKLSPEEAMSLVGKYAARIAELVGINSRYTFTLGISNIYMGFQNLNKCYNESYHALNYRLILGFGHIINYKEIMVERDYTVLYPFQIEKDILNNLKLGDSKGIIHSLNEFSDYFYNNPIENIETVRHYFLQLLSASLKTLYEIDRSLYSSVLTDKNIYTSLLSEETMAGMSAYINRFFESVLQYIKNQKNERNNELIGSLTEYIKGNLHLDLSVERLAEQYHMSASYLRKVFKDETGEPIKEYIDRERMKKAKALLENPSIKIRDISVEIGYISVTSFARAFKQETGKTPSEYREDFLMK